MQMKNWILFTLLSGQIYVKYCAATQCISGLAQKRMQIFRHKLTFAQNSDGINQFIPLLTFHTIV